MPFWSCRSRRWRFVSLCLAFGWGFASARAQPSPPSSLHGEPSGLIVEEVEGHSLGDRAGLRPGDLLLAWSREASGWANPLPAGGIFTTPFGFEEIAIEQAPRGALTLAGLREGTGRSWTLLAGASASRIGVRVRPQLSPSVQLLYDEGSLRLTGGTAQSGAELWRQAAVEASGSGDWGLAAWLLGRRAEALAKARAFADADRAWSESVAAQRRSGYGVAAALSLGKWAESLWRQARWEEARRRSAEAVALVALLPRSPLLRAAVLYGRGETLRQAGDLNPAEEAHRSALMRVQAEAPGGLEEAERHFGLGRGLSAQERDREAEESLLQAALLQRRLDPDSLAYARTLDALGVLGRAGGRLAAASDLLRESLRLSLALAGRGSDAGRAQLHLSQVSRVLGDLPQAQELLFEARRCFESLPEDSLSRENLVHVYTRLSAISLRLGDAAGRWFGRRALEMQQALAPESMEMAQVLDSLSEAEGLEGNYLGAREYARQAVSLKERLRPESLGLAYSLDLLGQAKAAEGAELAAAERDLRRARDLYVRLAPASDSWVVSVHGLGVVARKQGRMKEALELGEQAVRLFERSFPAGPEHAMALASLALAERQAGFRSRARAHFCSASELLDRFGERLPGGPTLRGEFALAYSEVYDECIASLVDQSSAEAAFQVLERGRARGLLSLIASREVLGVELPADLIAERSRLRAELAATYAELSEPGAAAEPPEPEAVQIRRSEILRREESLLERVRRDSPRFATLHYPLPLDPAGVRKVLDPGTSLLAYAVARKEAFLFLVHSADRPGPRVAVIRLATDAASLRSQIDGLRQLLGSPRSERSRFRSASRRLYDLLIQPVESRLDGSQRLLISPDGPLHSLPFAALLRRDGRYLVEWKPIHTVISATVYAELKKQRKPAGDPGQLAVAGFGDPSYPRFSRGEPEVAADLRLRSALRRGLALSPLPSSRREVEALGRLYPQAEIFVGPEASEERAKSLGRDVRIIHFAGHALLDERLPLSSSLALAIPESPQAGQEDGLLESWEIFEQMRIDADLVTLSACNTALGKEMGGEGLIGLTRAFQFAGARSILASLWAIGDGSTARFMPRFYEHLRSGLTKDEALRRTQIEWLRHPRTAHPFYWAAFELIGDYR